MDKFIGFDIDHKHTLACVVQAGQPDRYTKLRTDMPQLREWLEMPAGPAARATDGVTLVPPCTSALYILSGAGGSELYAQNKKTCDGRS